jgi:hypothetical protein
MGGGGGDGGLRSAELGLEDGGGDRSREWTRWGWDQDLCSQCDSLPVTDTWTRSYVSGSDRRGFWFLVMELGCDRRADVPERNACASARHAWRVRLDGFRV